MSKNSPTLKILKKILIAILFFICKQDVQAQDTLHQNIYVGLRAAGALNQLTFYANSGGTTSLTTGYAGGLFIEKSIWKNFYLVSEVNFVTKGGTFKGSAFSQKLVERLNYLSLPILLDLRNPVQSNRSGVYFGLEYCRLLSASQSRGKGREASTSNAAYQYRRSNLLCDLGLSSAFFRQTSAEIRFSFGLLDILSKKSDLAILNDYGLRDPIKNISTGSFQLGLQQRF